MRRAWWNKLAVLKFHGQKPAVIPPPAADEQPIELVPFISRHPDIPIDGIVVAGELPRENLGRGVWVGVKDTFAHFGLTVRCSLAGTFIGIMPGLGGGVAQWIAYGQAVQTARKLLGRVLRTELPLGHRVEAAFHMLPHFAYPAMVLLTLVLLPALIFMPATDIRTLVIIDLPLCMGATGSLAAFYGMAEKAQGRSIWSAVA